MTRWATLYRADGLHRVRTHADPVSFLVERYLEMLDHGADAIATAVAILGAPGRLPAVFHCAAGKDRTGVLAALVLAVAGVADETIAADYALSASAMDRIVAWYRSTEPEVVDRMVDQPQQLLACPAEAMVEFLGQLRDRYGSVEDYLIQAGASARRHRGRVHCAGRRVGSGCRHLGPT